MTADQVTSTDTAPPAPRREPPAWLFRAMNAGMKGALRSPLGKRIGQTLALITFKGRKSGKVFTTPVGYHLEGNTVHIFALPESKWWRNLLDGGATVGVNIAGRKAKGWGEVIDDPGEKAHAAKPYFEKQGAAAARMLGVDLDPSGQNDLARYERAAEKLVLVRVTLGDRRAAGES